MFRSLVVWCGLVCLTFADENSVLSVFQDVIRIPQREGRIVGGQGAALGQFPYQVSLRTTSGSHFCGAFVISNRFIGTASHCTQTPRNAGNIVAVVGTIQRSNGGFTHRIARIINHPNFDNSNLANDVSVLQTVNTIVFNNIVAPVIIGSNYVNAGENAIATGFGQTSRNGPASSSLLWVGLRTLSNDECKSKFSRSNAARILDSTICTFTRNGQGTCMGDSGGPLVMNNNVLIGVVSWGIPCANGHPDVYARVSSHRAWIMNQVQ